MESNLETVLYLIGKKGLIALQALVDAGHCSSISTVVVATDKGVVEDYSEEIKSLAEQRDINVFDRTDKQSSKLSGTYAFAIGWRWLIETSKYDTIIVFHDSLLPKYRGFAPLVAQLINGETKIGVTAIVASAGYDEGPIVSQESITIDYPIKVEKAIKSVAQLYGNQIVEILDKITNKRGLSPVPQNDAAASYSVWRDDEDLRIDWTRSSEEIKRFVDATGFPFNGAFSMLDNKRIVIKEVELEPSVHLEFRHTGKTIMFRDGNPIVICGNGLIKITEAYWYDSGTRLTKWPKFRMRFV